MKIYRKIHTKNQPEETHTTMAMIHNAPEDSILARGNALLSNGDTAEKSASRFMENTMQLFEHISSLNTYIGDTTGTDPPVAICMMTLATAALEKMGAGKFRDTMTPFLVRVYKKRESIQKYDAAAVATAAEELFPELPLYIINSVCNIVRSNVLPVECIEDLFDQVHALIRIALGKVCMERAETKIPNTDISDDEILELYTIFQKPDQSPETSNDNNQT